MKLNDLYPDGNYCLLKIGWDEGLKPYYFRWVLLTAALKPISQINISCD